MKATTIERVSVRATTTATDTAALRALLVTRTRRRTVRATPTTTIGHVHATQATSVTDPRAIRATASVRHARTMARLMRRTGARALRMRGTMGRTVDLSRHAAAPSTRRRHQRRLLIAAARLVTHARERGRQWGRRVGRRQILSASATRPLTTGRTPRLVRLARPVTQALPR